MRKTVTFLIVVLQTFFLHSSENDPFKNFKDYQEGNVALEEGLPNGIVNNSVCVITGGYVDNVVDIVTPGNDPLIYSRTYSSLSPHGKFAVGWSDNHRDRILTYCTYNHDHEYQMAALKRSNGAVHTFKREKSDSHDKRRNHYMDLERAKGMTHVPEEMGGQRNINNCQMGQKAGYEGFSLKDGAHNNSSFKRIGIEDGCDAFYEESKAMLNGLALVYEDSPGKGILTSHIELRNTVTKKKYGFIDFSAVGRPDQTHWIVLNSSDGRKVRYKMFVHRTKSGKTDDHLERNKMSYLDEVTKEHGPWEKYKYQKNEKDNYLHIREKRKPNQHILSTRYYHKGENSPGDGRKVNIDDKEDYRIDRVMSQFAPVGDINDRKLHIIYSFVYNKKIRKNLLGQTLSYKRSTDVYDAHNHKTTYEYNKQDRLIGILKHTGTDEDDYKIFSREGFYWGEGGYLKRKALLKGDSSMAYIAYDYKNDDYGNLQSKKLYGNLTGNQEELFELDKDLKPVSTAEYELKTYSHSRDGVNLLTRETDSNGTITKYSYYDGTKRLKSKILFYDGRNQIREFYEYNDDNFMIKKIIDDGGRNEITNLDGVTERKITYYDPRDELPILANDIVEKYLDFSTDQETLLKRTHLEYDKCGNVIAKTTYNNEAVESFTELYTYNKHGKVIEETNAIGQVVKKEYDDNDNLTKQYRVGSGFTIVNEYDYSDRLFKQSEQYQDFHKTTYTTHNKYNYLHQREKSTDTYGNETTYEYNDFGLVTKTISPSVAGAKGIIVKPVTDMEYDLGGFPCKITDANGKIKEIKCTIRGKPYYIKYPDGSEERFTYKVDGQLAQKIARDGTKTVYKSDGQNRIESELVYGKSGTLHKSILRTYTGFHLRTETDSEGTTISYQYNYAGQLVATFKNDLLIQQLIYDDLGRIGESRDYFGKGSDDYRSTVKRYDNVNRIESEEVFTHDQILLSSTKTAYDLFGNKAFIQEGDRITKTTYNTDGKPILIKNSEGHATHIEYKYDFVNEFGQFVLQTIAADPMGKKTIETYDTANRLVKTVKLNYFGNTVYSQKIAYDRCGNKVKVTDDVIFNEKVEKSIYTLYTYTTDNQIESITEAAGTPEQKITWYQYNTFGQKIAKIKPDGVHIHFDYDGIGRLNSIKSDESIHYTYKYNGHDQVMEVNDMLLNISTKRTYNAWGQLEEEILGNGLRLTQNCDLFDRPLNFTLPDSSIIEYIYNAAHLKEIRRIINGEKVYSHLNQEYGQPNQITLARLPGNAGSIRYSYDKLGHCTEIKSPTLNQTVPEDGYDGMGNLMKYKSEDKTYQFTYDHLYQLSSEMGHVRNKYEYDSLQNRRIKNGVNHDNNNLNQLITRGAETYTYDLNGNLVQRTDGEDVTTYKYDALDRLVSVTINGVTTTYQYDAFHRRLSKMQAGQPDTLFFYQGQEEIGAWQNGSIVQLKVLNQNQRRSVAVELNQTPYIPTQDLFGNVAVLSDLEGNIIEKYRYTSFGEVEIFNGAMTKLDSSAVNNPWQYSNKRIDQETGLTAFGLRYYDPELGRWISPDPAGFEDGANLYTYVRNNPLRYFDLLGLFAEERRPFEGFLLNFNLADNFITKFFKNIGNMISGQPCDFSNIKSTPYSLNKARNSQTNERYNYAEDPKMKTMYVNGILNSFTDFLDGLTFLGGMSGLNVHGIYNSSFGLGSDLFCYFSGLLFGINYDPCRLMQSEWDEFFKNNPEDGMIHVICHSRGCVYVRNALRTYPPELRDRIVVTAVAPGAYIDRHLCRDVQHYVSTDIVPWLDIAGRFRCRDTIVNLKPAPTTSVWKVHGFTDDTYKDWIDRRIQRFNNGGFK